MRCPCSYCNDARTRFRIGDRVRFSREGLKLKLGTADEIAVVSRFGKRVKQNAQVFVKREGQKSEYSWHVTFWERI